MQNAGELEASLRQYREEQAEVAAMLREDPTNEELLSMHSSLAEVVALTEDLLRSAGGGGGGAAGAAAPASRFSSAPPAGLVSAPGMLRTNWAPGESCQALFTDGVWYEATVQAAAPGGYKVLFDHYAVPVSLPASSLRPPLLGGADAVYVGVPAPKRLKVDESLPKEIPKKLEILPTDDERTREKKRKLVKSLKSKMRLQEAEAAQAARAQSWQAFRSGKTATKHKAGFLTDVKKAGEMFAVPEGTGGRVGVIGSGKAPAPLVAPKRHVHDQTGATEDEAEQQQD